MIELDASNNKLPYIDTSTISQIQILNYSRNALAAFDSTKLPQLTVLDISYNGFSTEVLYLLGNSPNFKTIIVAGNTITGYLGAVPWKNMQYLQYVDISNCKLIAGFENDTLLMNYDLKFMNASNNVMDRAFPLVRNSPLLETVDFSNNLMPAWFQVSFAGLFNLKNIFVQNNKLQFFPAPTDLVSLKVRIFSAKIFPPKIN